MALVRYGTQFDNEIPLPLDDGSDELGFLALVAKLALEDVEELQSQAKGKGRAGEPSSADTALRLYAEEAEGLLRYAEEGAFARSLDAALETDRAALAQAQREEAIAQHDHAVAQAFAAGRPAPPTPTWMDQAQRTPSIRNIPSSSSGNQLAIAGPEGAVEADSGIYVRSGDRRDCTICGDRITTLGVRAPCGKHAYGIDCLKELFRMVTNDESLYPPRCCSSTFVVDAVASVLGASLLAAFNKKAREFSAPDRVYCHVKTCSEFLGPVTNAPTASTCPTCISRTCTRCKSAAHGPFTSCDAQQDEEVLALGEREGWKRSPACNALIELAYGCYHMTCRCRKQFCYVCRETWKNCTCPQWEKNRLIAAAQDRVRRQEPPPAPAGSRAVAIPVPVPFERVLREAERLRDNHEYRHPSWRYRAGGGHCESCYHFLAQFLFSCKGCQMLACVRCRRNRL